MNRYPDFTTGNAWITHLRGKKNQLDPNHPYAVLLEKELSNKGTIEDVLTVFLTNRECPFKCLMCDLWKNTTDYSVEAGQIIQQISEAIQSFPKARYIKLYNAGNFFDDKAIAKSSYKEIASLVSRFDSVIIENHPRLIDNRCLEFKNMLSNHLEVALGLETVHPQILEKLNKQMSLKQMEQTLDFLHRAGISSRLFILLRPPFLTEEEGVLWAKKSVDWAFDHGVACCTIIPTRAGNGAMEWLQQNNYFHPPALESLEEVLAYGIAQQKGRVFADLWDLHLFSACSHCFEERRQRMQTMNLQQAFIAPVACSCN